MITSSLRRIFWALMSSRCKRMAVAETAKISAVLLATWTSVGVVDTILSVSMGCVGTCTRCCPVERWVTGYGVVNLKLWVALLLTRSAEYSLSSTVYSLQSRAGNALSATLHATSAGAASLFSRQREQHDIGACPFAHSGEKAARRDLRVFKYDSSACPDVLQSGRCPRGISCNMAHSVFEYWLHPQRYRTQMCRDGASCTRKVCFFAHSDQELRHVPGISADASDPFSKAAKFSLSGMKRQKSASLAQASCGTGSSHSGSMDRSSSGGSTSSRLLFQPTYQATGLDLMSAFSGDVMSSSSTCSMGSSAYPNSMLRNSSIDLSSRSRKSSMDEYSSNLVARRSLDASMLAPAAGLYATGQLPRQCCAPGSPLPPHSTLASASSADTTARVMPGGLTAGLWVENITLPAATAGPSAVAACLGLPATANHDSNSTTDPTAYIQMLSAYQQQAETCRLQAAMADAAATAAVGKLQAICGALGWPDSGMYPQPSSLACNLTVGLEPSGLGMPGLTGVSLHSLWPVAPLTWQCLPAWHYQACQEYPCTAWKPRALPMHHIRPHQLQTWQQAACSCQDSAHMSC
eukprot:GHUV01002316.1.p1 GENE.GHUV01002316.1~~GHUV01002316.1.p1  ORF type:complete len:578 (+),score=123.64 GHUV01002316.1:300-2033(+)